MDAKTILEQLLNILYWANNPNNSDCTGLFLALQSDVIGSGNEFDAAVSALQSQIDYFNQQPESENPNA